MPPRARAAATSTCAFVEQGRRCRRKGQGSPPLCAVHQIAAEAAAVRGRPGAGLASVLGRIIRGEKVTDDVLQMGVEDFVNIVAPVGQPMGAAFRGAGDRVRAAAQSAAREAAAQARARAGAGQAPRGERPWWWNQYPPPGARPPPAAAPPGPDPRIALGFAAGQKVTVAEVKKRRSELARKFHPDRPGGSTEKMAVINDACDRLLAELG